MNRKKTIFDVLYQKRPAWTIKTSVLKTHKIRIFLKGLVHGLGPKFSILLKFFLWKIQLEKLFAADVVWKQAFLDDRNMNLKRRKIGIFAKRIVHDFGQKV